MNMKQNDMIKLSNRIKTLVVAFALGIVGLLTYLLILNSGLGGSTTYQIDLSELSDGVYAYRETVVSAIPAENYTIATICDDTGNIYTIKGRVTIVGTNKRPYAIWESTNIVNGDSITIYAPVDTIKYLGAVTVH